MEEQRKRYPLFWLVCLFGLGGAVLRIGFFLRHWDYTIWTDRDLFRAAHLTGASWFFGPEVSGGGRIPGTVYYPLLRLGMLVSRDPEVLHWMLGLGLLLAVAKLASVFYRQWGKSGAALAVLILLNSQNIVGSFGQIWNPSLALIFILFAYAYLLEIAISEDDRKIPWLFAHIFVASQIHLTALLLVPLSLVVITKQKIVVRPVTWFRLGLVFCLLWGPLIIYLMAEGRGMAWGQWGAHRSEVMQTPWARALRNLGALKPLSLGLFEVNFPHHSLVEYLGNFAASSLFLLLGLGGKSLEPLSLRLARKGSVLLGFGMILLLASVPAYCARYAIVLAPLGLLVVILSTLSVVAAATRPMARWPQGISVVLVLAAVSQVGFGWRPQMAGTGESEGFRSAKEMGAALEILAREFHFSHQDLEGGVVVLLGQHGEWKEPGTWNRAASYLIDLIPEPLVVSKERECALVLIQSDIGPHASVPLSASLKRLPHLESRQILKTLIQPNRIFLSYAPVEGNCYRTLSNPYLLSPVEEEFFGLASQLHSPGVFWLSRNAGQTRFLVLDPQGHLGDEILVELTFKEGEVQAVVNSSRLRGFDGIYSRELISPRIRFKDRVTGKLRELTIYEGAIGGPFVFSPWRSRRMSLPAGHYQLNFISGAASSDLGLGGLEIGPNSLAAEVSSLPH